ncbi:hypothetical protein NDU88_007273 [Pleurodeles waltl]|uniref:Uncharacterized protein n=1 Tax=Pleurodeles waltl TaxID=8319 RepID=A0AAV7U2J8_PLEWA|nr:hypothetical protein NDU88_007273 [Pleurodeles waltl]
MTPGRGVVHEGESGHRSRFCNSSSRNIRQPATLGQAASALKPEPVSSNETPSASKMPTTLSLTFLATDKPQISFCVEEPSAKNPVLHFI